MIENLDDLDLENKILRQVDIDIQKSKYNFKQRKKELVKKRMQFIGSLKHLRNNTISPIKNNNYEI